MDVQKAFDKVHHPYLIFKLIQLGIPCQLIKILNDYLSSRTFVVKVGNSISYPVPVLSSVPQGSLLGPRLFLLFTNDIPRTNDVTLAKYADDTAILCTRKRPHTVFNILQNYLKIYENWLKKWRITVNSSKSAAIFFTNQNFTPNNNLILNNEPIPWETSYKYLGMHLDSKLMWQKHISESLDKAEKAMYSLDNLLARKSRLSLKNKLLLYKSYTKPILT